MNTSSASANRIQTITGIIRIIVSTLIGTGVVFKLFDFDSKAFRMATAFSGEVETTDVNIEKLDLMPLVPNGYKKHLNSEIYFSETLYEKINGRASLYIDAGFNKLLSQRFVRIDDEKQWLEVFIYEMASQRSAFCVYSTQKRHDATPFPHITGFAYRTSNSLHFILGRYYFEMIASSDSKELFEAISFIGQEIKSNIFKTFRTDIPELSLMKHQSIVPGSIRLNIKNAFGFEELTNTFSAEYVLGNETTVGFISMKPDAEKAEQIAERYYRFLIEYDAKEVKSNLGSSVRTVNLFDSITIIFSMGRYVGGVHEAENQEVAEKTAKILIQNLSSRPEPNLNK